MESILLNVAATLRNSTALGPGLRSIIWVQGCPFTCRGCYSPEWIPFKPGILLESQKLAHYLLEDPEVNGLTLSGGEPMLQANALALLIIAARAIREINVICFSGFTLSQLKNIPDNFGVKHLLDQIDVLVDGPYISDLNNDIGLRGSTNQVIHRLTHRLDDYDLENQPRGMDIHVDDGYLFLAGVPTRSVSQGLLSSVKPNQLKTNVLEVNHVRS